MKKIGLIILPIIGIFLAYYYWKISADKKAAPKTADALPEKVVEDKVKEIVASGLVPIAPPKQNPTHIKIAPAITPNPVIKPTVKPAVQPTPIIKPTVKPAVQPTPTIKPAVQAPMLGVEERLIRDYSLASSRDGFAYEPTVLRASSGRSIVRDSSGVIDRSRAITAMR